MSSSVELRDNFPIRREIAEPSSELAFRNTVTLSLDSKVGEWIDEGRFLLPSGSRGLWSPGQLIPNTPETMRLVEEESRRLHKGTLVVLGGNTITEDALPSYQTTINRSEAIRDRTGADRNGWSRWSRGWTAEEKRHGDVLSDYLHGTNGFDLEKMREVTYSLIREGFDPHSQEDPYKILIYATMQEQATKISHNRTGRLAELADAPILANICRRIGADEGRHYSFYRTACAEVAKCDPEGFVDAFYTLAHKEKMGMPGAVMDGFEIFAEAGQYSGMYTAGDYVRIVAALTQVWELDGVSGLTPEGEQKKKRLITYRGKNTETINKHVDNAIAEKWEGQEMNVPWITGPLTLADIAQVV